MDKKRQNYETELPEGYEPVFEVDATNKKLSVWLNVGAFVLFLALFVPLVFLIRPFRSGVTFRPLSCLIFILAMFAYIVLHELLHGAAYKILTGRKLTFGFKGTVAFCGVPDIYVYRKTALISLLTPFTVFFFVFGAAVLLISEPVEKFLSGILFSMHVSGCIGDLYDTCLYLFRFRDPKTLMQDTGPKQTFYEKNA